MIKHIVILQFIPTLSNAEIKAIMDQLSSLKSLIPSIQYFSYGENCSSEQLNKGFNYAFTMDFLDEVGRNAYLNHPEHIRIAQEVILPVLVNGFESVLVVDYKF